MSEARWRKASRANPCPACGKPDWCAWTPDGAMLKCERVQSPPSGMVLVKIVDGGALFKSSINSSPKRRIVEMYPYHDETGELLFEVIRYAPKSFRQRRPDGKGGWVWRLDGTPRVLYRLPEILKADPDTWIFVVEGELDADNMRALGLFVTCNPGGAGKWGRLADDSALHGRRVVILPDKDSPGRRHAQEVAHALHGKATEVKVVELPGDSKDASDWITTRDGHSQEETRAELLGLVDAAPVWIPPTKSGIEDDELDAAVSSLANLSELEYERARSEKAEALGIRKSVLDRIVRAARQEKTGESKGQGQRLVLPEPEPWDEPVDGAALLDDLVRAFKRYLALVIGAAETLALWVVYTYLYDLFNIAARLALISPEKRCGKTTTLTVVGHLVPRPLHASNLTPAVVFRTIDLAHPTLLMDEAGTFVHSADEFRGILNSGHTRAGAFVVRTVGDDFEPRRFSTWTPMAFALIGKLPDTLSDRSIVIPMRRRQRDEKIDRFRHDRTEDLKALARKAARWAVDKAKTLREVDPTVPETLNDRAADNWRPLIAIADAAGGQWPQAARDAALDLSGDAEDDQSRRVMLLHDLRDLFANSDTDRLASAMICERLAEREDRPWPEFRRGKPLTARQLAKLLQAFGVRPRTVRIDDETAKGYRLEELTDSFNRYLPPSPSVTPTQSNVPSANRDKPSVTTASNVTEAETRKPLQIKDCDAVTDENTLFTDVDGIKSPNGLPDDRRLEYEERAAIMEHDGGLPRERAEALALDDVLSRMCGAAELREKEGENPRVTMPAG